MEDWALQGLSSFTKLQTQLAAKAVAANMDMLGAAGAQVEAAGLQFRANRRLARTLSGTDVFLCSQN